MLISNPHSPTISQHPTHKITAHHENQRNQRFRQQHHTPSFTIIAITVQTPHSPSHQSQKSQFKRHPPTPLRSAKGEIPRYTRNDRGQSHPSLNPRNPRFRQQHHTPSPQSPFKKSSTPCVSLRSPRPPFADAKRGGECGAITPHHPTSSQSHPITQHPLHPLHPCKFPTCREIAAGAAKQRQNTPKLAANCR